MIISNGWTSYVDEQHPFIQELMVSADSLIINQNILEILANNKNETVLNYHKWDNSGVGQSDAEFFILVESCYNLKYDKMTVMPNGEFLRIYGGPSLGAISIWRTSDTEYLYTLHLLPL